MENISLYDPQEGSEQSADSLFSGESLDVVKMEFL